MKVQNGSFAMMGSNYTHTVKDAKAANNMCGGNKTGSPNAGNVSLSSNSQFNKMIESIQEQIQKVHENDHYDADTKKSKIEELENQLKEIEKAKAEQLKESVLSQKTKSKNDSSNDSAKNTARGKYNTDGVVLDISINAKALLEADNSLKNLKDAHSMKVKFECESNVLKSEIKIDKGCGVNTAGKEDQLAKLKEGVENSLASIGEAIQDANNAARDTSESAIPTVATGDDSRIDREEKSAKVAADVLNNILAEPISQEKAENSTKHE